VVLGLTAGRSSVEIIGRYKTEEELRDVLLGDIRAAWRAARRLELYVFEECPYTETCLHLITFDIREVAVRDPRRARAPVRKASHEYTDVKEMLYSRLCGSVDLSTYVCPEDYSRDVGRYLASARAAYSLASFYVRPWRDVDRELVVESIRGALEWLTARALSMASKVSNVAPQGYGQVRKKALGFLEELLVARDVARRAEVKLRALGIELQLLQAVLEAERYVREALERREELRARGR
jgi:hypothetical protein